MRKGQETCECLMDIAGAPVLTEKFGEPKVPDEQVLALRSHIRLALLSVVK